MWTSSTQGKPTIHYCNYVLIGGVSYWWDHEGYFGTKCVLQRVCILPQGKWDILLLFSETCNLLSCRRNISLSNICNYIKYNNNKVVSQLLAL